MPEPSWQLPPKFDRLQINALLTTLSGGWDKKTALQVITAFHALPASTVVQPADHLATLEGARDSDISSPSRDIADQKIERLESIRGPEYAFCVGNFLVYRVPLDEVTIIVFQKNSTEQSLLQGPPLTWHLGYHSNFYIPLEFSRLEAVNVKPSFWNYCTFWFHALRRGLIPAKLTTWQQKKTVLYSVKLITVK